MCSSDLAAGDAVTFCQSTRAYAVRVTAVQLTIVEPGIACSPISGASLISLRLNDGAPAADADVSGSIRIDYSSVYTPGAEVDLYIYNRNDVCDMEIDAELIFEEYITLLSSPAPPTPAPDTPIPPTPAPLTPSPPTPLPPTPLPPTPAPSTSLPTPVPETSIPATPAPPTSAPPTPAPPTQLPSTPAPPTPAPQTVPPPTPVPPTASPLTLSPPTKAPTTAAPATPSPPTLPPPTSAPTTPAPPTQLPSTPAPPTPAPQTVPPPTTSPPTMQPPTPAPSTPLPTPVPETSVPATPAPPTSAPPTPAPPTQLPSTPAPPTPAPQTVPPPTPVPPTASPPTLSPPTKAPTTAAPATPSPPTLPPPTSAPTTPKPLTRVPLIVTPLPSSPAPPSPSPATPFPSTPQPQTPEPLKLTNKPSTAGPTLVPSTMQPQTSSPPAPLTQTPSTPAAPSPRTPVPPAATSVPAPPTRLPAAVAPVTPPPPTPPPRTPSPVTTRPLSATGAPRRDATILPATAAPGTAVPLAPSTTRQLMPRRVVSSAPRPPPAALTGVEYERLADSTSAAAIVGAVAGGGGGALRLAVAAAPCDPSIAEASGRYTRALSPLQLVVMDSWALGTVVGNTVLAAAACVVGYAVAVLGRLYGARVAPWVFDELDAQGVTFFPSAPLAVFQCLYQGTSLAVMDLIDNEHPVAARGVGLVGLAVCIGVPLVVLFAVRDAVPLKATVHVDPIRNPFKRFFLSDFEWLSKSRDCHWANRWSIAVRPYTQSAAWFLFIEFCGMFAVSAISAAAPETWLGCGHAAVAMALVFAMMLALEVSIWPHLHQRNAMFDVMLLGGQAAASTATAVGHYMHHALGSPGVSMMVGGVVLQYCVAVILLRLVCDAISVVWNFVGGRRYDLQLHMWERHDAWARETIDVERARTRTLSVNDESETSAATLDNHLLRVPNDTPLLAANSSTASLLAPPVRCMSGTDTPTRVLLLSRSTSSIDPGTARPPPAAVLRSPHRATPGPPSTVMIPLHSLPRRQRGNAVVYF